MLTIYYYQNLSNLSNNFRGFQYIHVFSSHRKSDKLSNIKIFISIIHDFCQ